MAKTYEELLEQAAIIRDETAAGKNTATRVGGTITDAVDYVKNLQDTYAGIHAEAAEAKTTAKSAKLTAEQANKKNAEQDNRLSNAEEQNTKQNERLLNYVYPKLYQLNEGAGARVFDGFTEETGDGELILTKDTYRYSVLYSTTQKQFVLNVTDEASGVTVLYSSWPKISLPNNKSIASSESYAERDKLYYIYVSGEGSTYYYIDSDGVASEKSATYLLRLLANKNAAAIAALQGNDAAQDEKIAGLQSVQDHGARNLSLSGRVLQMKDMYGLAVGDSVTLPDNGNLYEGTAGASSVPVVLAKTFGGTVNATLGAATSARAGVMTVDHVNKIKKLEERMLQYLYPKIYQLNEGAGALPFDGMYSGSASVLDGRKTVAEDGYTYKVVFALMLKKFLLQEISPGGVTIGFYEYWDKIISGRGSSEDYTRRDCLYYVYTEGEGSTYYYIDSNGVAIEQSATYLLRRLVDKNADAIVVLKTTTENAQNKLNNYSDTFPQNPVASLESNGLMSVADKVKVDNYPEQFVLDLGIVESQAYGEREAAKSEVAGNRNISFIRFQVRGVKELKTTLIMQWPNGIHETAQIMCVDKQQWRRNVTGATGVVGAPTNAYNWSRTAPHSIVYDEQRRIIQLKDYENQTVSQGVELPLATSSQHGLMSISDKEKISAMESKLSALEARVAALENK